MIIEELLHYPVRGIVLKPIEENADLGDTFSSLSFVAGTITNYLLEKSIPHNIIFSDVGTTVYIIPRQHEDNYKTKAMKSAWLELSGLIVCRDAETYDKISKEGFEEILREQVSLGEKEFNEVKEDVLKVFKTTFE